MNGLFRNGVTRTQLIVFFIASFVCALVLRASLPNVVYSYERIAMTISPSAERAFAYAERHFSSRGGDLYDIEQAEMFLERTLELDPSHPHAWHEYARVAFLKGDFDVALSRIDMQLEKHGDILPNSHYVRGLILGFMGRHEEAVEAYERFLAVSPTNWAGVNDYAWVLLKADRSADALAAIEEVLSIWDENPWLLNSAAIAAYELGEYDAALSYVRRAGEYVQTLEERDWLIAYPGNDPKIAKEGIEALKKSIGENMHTIEAKFGTDVVE